MSTSPRPTAPGVDRDFHLRDLVGSTWGKAVERAGRDAASRYGHDDDDGAQEAWAIACEHAARGYPPAEVLRLTVRDLDSRWSTLRQYAHDDPRTPPRSRVAGGGVRSSGRKSQPVPITALDKLTARMTSSTLGPQLDRLMVSASLHCPECGRRGHWMDWVPDGCRKAVQRARGWVLYGAADADGLEPGTPTGGGHRVEETRPAQCVAGTEPVWVCGEPWGRRPHWTRQPVAVLREGGDPGDGMHVHGGGGDTGRVERDFVSWCDELAEERAKRPGDDRWQGRNAHRVRLWRPTSSISPEPCTSAAAQARSG
jgi:hypothetical protein